MFCFGLESQASVCDASPSTTSAGVTGSVGIRRGDPWGLEDPLGVRLTSAGVRGGWLGHARVDVGPWVFAGRNQEFGGRGGGGGSEGVWGL